MRPSQFGIRMAYDYGGANPVAQQGMIPVSQASSSNGYLGAGMLGDGRGMPLRRPPSMASLSSDQLPPEDERQDDDDDDDDDDEKSSSSFLASGQANGTFYMLQCMAKLISTPSSV